MFLHDLGRTGANLQEVAIAPLNASDLQPIWTYNTTGAVTGSMAEVNGTVYFGAWDGYLYAVNAYNGSREWRTALPGPSDYTSCGEPGIAGTPAVWNGTVFVGGGNPFLYAVSAANGSVLWHVDLANVTGSASVWTAHKIWSSPALYHGSLYIGVASGCDAPLVRGALFQIGLADHKVDHVFWTLPAHQIGPGIWSSPSIDPASNTVWATTGNEYLTDTTYARSVVELNASNVSQLLGYAQRSPPFVDFDFGDGATLFHSWNGTPMAVAVNKNGVAYAFNESDLNPNGSAPNAWTRTLTPTQSTSYVPPAFDGRYLYFGTVDTVLPGGAHVAGSVQCVYPDNGTTRWMVGVSSAVYGGITYADGLVVVGLTNGGVDVLNASTGDPLFTAPTGEAWGEPLIVNGELLVSSGNTAGSTGGGSVQAWAVPMRATATADLLSGGRSTEYEFSTSITGGVVPYTIQWSFADGSNASAATVAHAFSAAGAYNVTLVVEDARGASIVRYFLVSANDPLDVYPSISVNPVHLGESTWINATVVGGGAPLSFLWSGLPPGTPSVGSTTSEILVLPAQEGVYNVSVVVNGSLGQSDRANITLWVDGPGSVRVFATPSVGPPPLTVSFQFLTPYVITSALFAWQFGDGGTSSTRAPSHTYLAPGRFPVSLTIEYPGGTQGNASTVVSVVEPLSLSAPSSLVTEVGRTVSINATVTGGLAPYSFDWQGLPAACPRANLSDLSCAPTAAGDYAIGVDVTDVLGTTETTNLLLSVANPPTVHAVVATNRTGTCSDPQNATVGVAATASGGVAPLTYSWSGPGGRTSSAANAVWTIAPSGPASFTVLVTDALGGSANSSVTVTPGLPECATSGSTPLAGAGAWFVAAGAIGLLAVAVSLVLWRRRRGGPS